jgi:hypothetical protein
VKTKTNKKKYIFLKPIQEQRREIPSRYIIIFSKNRSQTPCLSTKERDSKKVFASSSSEVCKKETNCFQSWSRTREFWGDQKKIAEKGKNKSHCTLTQTKPHKVQSCKEKHR